MNAHTPVVADINVRIEQYVRLRDKIKEIKDKQKNELKPFNEMLEQLNGVILAHLDATKVESVRADGGTAFKSLEKSASIADKSAFWSWVVLTGSWEMIDYKANAVAVGDYIEKLIEENKQDPTVQIAAPPGVNYTTTWEVNVRRPSKPKK